jgi:uncharacterized damage-inducible protein DinB
MSLAQSMLPEFDQEMGTTRKLLEATAEADPAWKPHPKSMSLGDLALHISNLVSFCTSTMRSTELDLAPPGGPAWKPPVFTSTQALLAGFDDNVQAARAAISAATDADMQVPWSLKKAGKPVFTLTRSQSLRLFVMNHLLHHRGQLSVYLRLCNVPLPRSYGPTADMPN